MSYALLVLTVGVRFHRHLPINGYDDVFWIDSSKCYASENSSGKVSDRPRVRDINRSPHCDFGLDSGYLCIFFVGRRR